MKDLVIEDSYNRKIYGNFWETKEPLKANVMIVHGMAEHSARYDDFAKFLNSLGYNVYAVDEFAHGKNVTAVEKPEYNFGQWPKDGFELCVQQVHALNFYIRQLNKLPIFVFGHSMGSFVTQRYYQLYSQEINGVILCGSSANNFTFKVSRFFTKHASIFLTKKAKLKPAKFLANTQARAFNKNIADKFNDGYESENRWISYNEDNVKAYDKDPACGFICSFNFYYSLSKNLQVIFDEYNLKAIMTHLPMLIISGQEDPVGGNGKYVERLQNLYMNHQDDVDMILYQNMRHEILNEVDHELVYKDVEKFLTKVMDKQKKD